MRTFRQRCIIAFQSAGVVRWLQCGFSEENPYLFRCKIQSVGRWLRLWRRRLPVASRQPSTQVGRSGIMGITAMQWVEGPVWLDGPTPTVSRTNY